MDAKERLRVYLEQRRELGESELVLDALPVEDVLRMIGAPSIKPSPSAPQTKAANVAPPARAEAPPAHHFENLSEGAASAAPVQPPQNPAARFDENAPVDWRAELRGVLGGDAPKADINQASAPKERASTTPVAQSAPIVDAMRVTASIGNAQAAMPDWLSALSIPAGLSVASIVESSANAAALHADSLSGVAGMIASCRACSLGASAKNPVPGEGNPNADFVCVGEAPGQTEDETGRPFVGEAGELLSRILAAIQLPRDEIFICNVLKHRPPGNRDPQPDEVRACAPFLSRQLELLQPKVILALGTFAAQTLLNTQTA
ncbi:MAG: uracil-DNA glycosylase family protein, partial [Gemmatimonadaceae bacterium]